MRVLTPHWQWSRVIEKGEMRVCVCVCVCVGNSLYVRECSLLDNFKIYLSIF